jgi:hypothetical protein
MKNYLGALLLLLLLSSFFSCNKEKDTKAPFVTIFSPFENQNFEVGGIIPVKFDVKDESKISFAEITLNDLDGIQVLSSVTYHDLENNQIVEHALLIDNYAIESGDYFLRIKVGDGKNEQTYFKKIYIAELPRKRRAIYFVTKQGLQHNVYKIDSSNSVNFVFPLNGDFIGATIDSKHQQMVSAGAFTGKLKCTNLTDLTERWSETPVGTAFPTYQYITQQQSVNLVSYTAGFIKGYDYAGASIFNAATVQNIFYPVHATLSEKFLLSEQIGFVGTVKKLVVYNYPSGSALQEINFNGETVALFSKSANDFFVFYNLNNVGKIDLYTVVGNGFSYSFPFSLNGKVLSVEQITANIYMIGTENGIYKFTYSPQNYVLFKSTVAATKMRYDAVNNQILVCEGTQIKVFDYISGMLVNTIQATDTVVDLQILYNR